MAKEKQPSVRDIYRSSRERVSEILTVLQPIKSDSKSCPSFEREYDRILNLMNSVVGSQRFENENDYRAVMDYVGSWALYALEAPYLEANQGAYPTPIFVIKKAVEVLHLLLHRDLRRRNLTNSENQLYNEFVRLHGHLPNPRRARLAQNDVDAMIEAEMKKQGHK